MRVVTPEAFKAAFQSCDIRFQSDLLELWNGGQPAYTHFMRSQFLPEVGRALGLEHYTSRDYCTLDGIFYEEKDTEHFPSDSTYAKYISVAIEHENNLFGSEKEMNKLQLFNSPIKVLITYTATKRERKAKSRFIAMFESIVSDADFYNDCSTLRRQVLIFGDVTPNDKGGKPKATDWDYRVYDSGKFVKF